MILRGEYPFNVPMNRKMMALTEPSNAPTAVVNVA